MDKKYLLFCFIQHVPLTYPSFSLPTNDRPLTPFKGENILSQLKKIKNTSSSFWFHLPLSLLLTLLPWNSNFFFFWISFFFLLSTSSILVFLLHKSNKRDLNPRVGIARSLDQPWEGEIQGEARRGNARRSSNLSMEPYIWTFEIWFKKNIFFLQSTSFELLNLPLLNHGVGDDFSS